MKVVHAVLEPHLDDRLLPSLKFSVDEESDEIRPSRDLDSQLIHDTVVQRGGSAASGTQALTFHARRPSWRRGMRAPAHSPPPTGPAWPGAPRPGTLPRLRPRPQHQAPVAQPDRVVASEAIGRGFESLRARHLPVSIPLVFPPRACGAGVREPREASRLGGGGSPKIPSCANPFVRRSGMRVVPPSAGPVPARRRAPLTAPKAAKPRLHLPGHAATYGHG